MASATARRTTAGRARRGAKPRAASGAGAAARGAALWAALAFLASRALLLATGYVAVLRNGVRPVQGIYLDPRHGRLAGALAARLLTPGPTGTASGTCASPPTATAVPSAPRSSRSTPCWCAPCAPWPAATWWPVLALSWAAVAVALWLLFVMVRARFDARTAAWTVAFLSFFPTSFFFTSVYSESLFLLCSVAAFFFAERRHWALAGLAGMLAVLTRPTGLLLVAPLALLMIEQDGARGLGGALRSLLRPRTLWLALLPLGLVLYAAYLQADTGHALAFMAAQRHWGRSLASPVTAVADGSRAAWRAAAALARHGLGGRRCCCPATAASAWPSAPSCPGWRWWARRPRSWPAGAGCPRPTTSGRRCWSSTRCCSRRATSP